MRRWKESSEMKNGRIHQMIIRSVVKSTLLVQVNVGCHMTIELKVSR